MGLVARATVLILTLVLASGCGQSQEETYCAALKARATDIADMLGDDGPDALLGHLPMLNELADRAPDDLTDEWQTFVNATQGLADALDEAEVRPQDFADGAMPSSLTAAERARISAAADELSTAETTDAVAGIDQQARDVCKLNLGL